MAKQVTYNGPNPSSILGGAAIERKEQVDPEIKKQWVEALRSGTYKQGKGQLCYTEDHFCCLGVLCDISGRGKWTTGKYGASGYSVNKKKSEKDLLPPQIVTWAGLNSSDPVVSNMTLSEMNDSGFTFDEIADNIEREL